MLKVHRIMIEQGKNWAVIRLRDKNEKGGNFVSGLWEHTDNSSIDRRIEFAAGSSDGKSFYYEWNGLHTGTLNIGVIGTSDSSHKTGQARWVNILITLMFVRRQANGQFAVASVLDTGPGILKHPTWNVNNFIVPPAILWSPIAY